MFASTAGVSGFRSEFFQPYRQKSEPPTDDIPAIPQSGPAISYSPDLHGSHQEFCDGPLFQQFRDEMRALLDVLIRFAVREGTPQHERKKITDGFNRLFTRRFDEPYLARYAELIDSTGKRSLESICELIRDETIALSTRRAVILNLSQSVGVCSGGTVSNLIAAERTLLMSVGGIQARLWKTKEDCTRSVLLQAVYENFGRQPGYVGNEIHFVNAVWNYLADEIGLEQVSDSLAPKLHETRPDFLNSCREKVYAAITPDKFAGIIAEQCLATFTCHVVSDTRRANGSCTEEVLNLFDVALNTVLLDLGLGADRLTLHAFVQIDDACLRYRLRSDATLIALALLDAIHAEGLMDDMPVHRGEWRDASGERAVLFDYGTLAWQSRLLEGVPVRPAWNDRNASPGPLTIPDLRAWKEAHGQDVTSLPVMGLRAAIRSSDPSDLIDMPGNWLVDAETAFALLARLGDDAARRYLDINLEYFLNDFPRGQRAEFIDGAIGTADAVLTLARCWYPDPWTLLNETRGDDGATRLQCWMTRRNERAIDAVRLFAEGAWSAAAKSKGKGDLILWRTMCGATDTPIFYEAMAAGDTRAIGIWRRLLCSPVVLPRVSAFLPELLIAKTKAGTSALYAAMYHNRAGAIEAFHDLLIDPAIMPRIKDKLPRIVTGLGLGSTGLDFGSRVNKRITALTIAMDRGNASAIRAYGKLLTDPAIFPVIRSKLPKLFGCTRVARTSLLWWAMSKGHADAVGAYHEILTNPCILERLKGNLPELIADKSWRASGSALHIALAKGKWGAIQAYHALVADPRVTPHIADVLPRLLLANDEWRTPGLAMALRNGLVRTVGAFHMMLVDGAILPHIRHALPRLLNALPLGKISGLAQAVVYGRAEAVKAFHAMLVDRQILPNIEKSLPDLLIARRVSGMRGLKWATKQGYTGTVAAYRAMLVDSALAPHISDAIRKRMPASVRSGTARPPESTSNSALPVAAQGEPALPHARDPLPATHFSPTGDSVWETEVDRWLAYYARDRSTGSGLVRRMMPRTPH